jgi:hypothetical protein
VPITAPPQGHNENCRHQQLHQRAAQQSNRLAEHPKYKVSGFVNGQIQTVQPAVGAGGTEADPAIYRQDQCKAQSPLDPTGL